LILPLKIGVNEFYGALQTRNIKAYRAGQMALALYRSENGASKIMKPDKSFFERDRDGSSLFGKLPFIPSLL